MTSGGLGESETGGVQMNIVPKQGGNTPERPDRGVRLLERGCSRTTTPTSCRRKGAGAPNPTYHVYDFNAAVGGPIMKDKLWYYMSVRQQGSRRNILNVYYNQNAGDPTKWYYSPDFNKPRVLRPAVGELHAAHHVAGVAEEQVHVLVGRAAGVPDVHRHGEFQRLAGGDDGAGSGRPRRVQSAARPDRALDEPVTSRLLLEAGLGNTYYQWGVRELDPNPGRDLIRVTENAAVINPTGVRSGR